MIFGQLFDNSLYYILKFDRKEKDIIIKFIEELPMDLLKNIRLEHNERANRVSHVNHDEKFYRVNSDEVPNISYKFNISFEGNLNITKYQYINHQDVEVMTLEVKAHNIKHFIDMPVVYSQEYLGSIVYANTKSRKSNKHLSDTLRKVSYQMDYQNGEYKISSSKEIIGTHVEIVRSQPVRINHSAPVLNRSKLVRKRLHQK